MELAVSRVGPKGTGVTINLGTLPAGDEGVAATVASIQAIVDHAVFVEPTSLRIAEIARRLLARAGGGTFNFAMVLWEWAREHVRFKKDPRLLEQVRHPERLLDAIDRTGVAYCDCDDLATLLASIIAAAGLRPVLITVGKAKDDRFRHIFVGIRLGDTLSSETVLPLDPQEQVPAGQWPAIAKRRKLWSLTVKPPAAK